MKLSHKKANIVAECENPKFDNQKKTTLNDLKEQVQIKITQTLKRASA